VTRPDDDATREPTPDEEHDLAPVAPEALAEATPDALVASALDHAGEAAGAELTVEASAAPPARSGTAALLVAAGIFASRLIGLVRDRYVGHFVGVGAHADVYRLALRAPNLLQNLLGEGTLSAAFIPVYSRMLAEGRREDAGRFAGAIFGLLAAAASVAALAGVALAPAIVAVLQPGWLGDAARVAAGTASLDRYALGVAVTRLTFPMTGFLVLSAWALGVLNSHRRFLLSYLAPVAWNVAILGGLAVGATLVFGGLPGEAVVAGASADALSRLLYAVFVGALAGGLLQFAVQLPTALRLMRGFRPSLSRRVAGVPEALRAFGPVVLGRGAYQLSGYLDVFLSSFLAAGALGALGNAQTLYLLPISLFGMSVAASELPELSRISTGELRGFLDRVTASLRQVLYLVVPTTVGYLAFGVLVVGALFQTGRFGAADTWLVALVLAGYTLGLAATTASRLLQNAFYALSDTKTPARLAVWRVAVSGVLGAALMVALDRVALAALVPGLPASPELQVGVSQPLRLGAVGLAAGSAVGAWVELWRLVAALRAHDASFRLPWRAAGRMAALAVGAAVPAAGLWWLLPAWPVWLVGALVLGAYGALYLAAGHALDLPESDAWLGRVLKRRRR